MLVNNNNLKKNIMYTDLSYVPVYIAIAIYGKKILFEKNGGAGLAKGGATKFE